MFIREPIHSLVLDAGARMSSSWDRSELQLKRRIPTDRPIVGLILAEEDGPGCGGTGVANTSRPRKFDGDSCRVKAGETRYPPADGRHEGHQKVAR